MKGFLFWHLKNPSIKDQASCGTVLKHSHHKPKALCAPCVLSQPWWKPWNLQAPFSLICTFVLASNVFCWQEHLKVWGLPLIKARQRGTGGVKSMWMWLGLFKAALALHSLFPAQGVVLLHHLHFQKPLGAQCLLACIWAAVGLSA